MIKVEHLVKRYGNLYALSDVSFEIGEGEIVGLLGPNGAGKSTMMNIITGYLSATSGDVYVDGLSIRENPLAVKQKIGFLPEQPPLYMDMTVEEYLSFVYELKGCTAPREEHLSEILAQVKLTDVRGRLIRNLSKGYRQRVGIAQALVGDPSLIIFDEPTVGLDPKQILEVRNLLRSLAKKHTVILSTHILAEVQSVCERVLIINRGRLIADERTDDLTRTVADGYRYEARIVGPRAEVRDALHDIQGMRAVETNGERDGEATVYRLEGERGTDIRSAVFEVCAKGGWPLVGLAPMSADLESVFIRLVDKAENPTASRRRR